MSTIKKAKPLSINAILSGAAHIEAVRGITNWGANWVFNSGGLQQDMLMLADTFKNFSTSGAYATDTEVANSIGIISGYIASGNMSISSHTALGVFSGFIGSGSTDLVPSWTEYGLLSGYIASGSINPTLTEYTALSGIVATNTANITTVSGRIADTVTNAMPSGGFYLNASDGTGIYQVTIPSQCVTNGSGYLVFTVV